MWFLKFKGYVKGTHRGVFNYRAGWVSPGKKRVVGGGNKGRCKGGGTALDTVHHKSALAHIYHHT